jgi:hypothetical protein
MTVHDDFLALAEWALRMQDLRHSYIRATSPSEVMRSAGLFWALETSVTLAIYEAALGKGYRHKETISYEQPYPGKKTGGNPRRSDLAIKEAGRGTKWSYIEIKYWNIKAIRRDIDKLKTIEKRAQRWILTYRVRKKEGRTQDLEKLLTRAFEGVFSTVEYLSFDSSLRQYPRGAICEVAFARVK